MRQSDSAWRSFLSEQLKRQLAPSNTLSTNSRQRPLPGPTQGTGAGAGTGAGMWTGGEQPMRRLRDQAVSSRWLAMILCTSTDGSPHARDIISLNSAPAQLEFPYGGCPIGSAASTGAASKKGKPSRISIQINMATLPSGLR